MVISTVKEFGKGGLHVTLSKKKFKRGQRVEVRRSSDSDVGEEAHPRPS